MNRVERFTLFSLTVVLFLLSESYLAKPFQFLFNFQYEPHLKSIEELLETEATIYSPTSNFLYHLNTTFPQSKNRFQLLPPVDQQFFQPDESKIICTLCHYAQGFVLSRQNLDPVSGFLRHYVLPARIPLTTDAYTHSKTQPFSQRFSRVYGHLHEAGLLDLWFEQFKEMWLTLPEVEVQVVKFGHLFSLWKLLAVGYGAGGIAFGLEIGVKFALNKVKSNLKFRIRKNRVPELK